MTPRVSIILPCRNEAPFIAACLDSIVATSWPRDRLELIVVDGQSDDGTREIVARYAATHSWIRLLDNPRRIVPVALNIAIGAASGDIILRMDAHALYPPGYVTRLATALDEAGADNVGGRIITRPGAPTAVARAVAIALSHPFGVGNSYFRIGTAEPRWVDTVPYGCYRREVFRRIGMFDEELVRNQDDEFNQRLVHAGGRILLLPDVTSVYFARPGVRQMARMQYQYGRFKPLVGHKAKRVVTLRQLVPPAFVLTIVAGALVAPFWSLAAALWLAVLAAYAVAVLGCVLHAAPRHGVRCAILLAGVVPVLHVAYGCGWLRGATDLIVGIGRRWRDPSAIPLTR